MAKSIFLAGLMVVNAAVATAIEALPRCNAPLPSQQDMRILREMSVMEANTVNFAPSADITVDTNVHVVSTSKKESDGYLSDKTIAKQMKVLNDTFAPSGISFNFKGADKTVNTEWANARDEVGMKTKLRKGDYKTLNLYYITNLEALGGCPPPTKASPGSSAYIYDGCTILAATAPITNGTYQGKTTTHEVGHWFGLLHTFNNGCDEINDEVDDTPAQAEPSQGCPIGADTCPDLPGLDPIHNYMDYSDDSCYEEFTAGQATRMKNIFARYRS